MGETKMDREYIRVLVVILMIIVICLLCGCSRTVSQNYEQHTNTEYQVKTVYDSVYIKELLENIRNTYTSRVDSVVILDSVYIKEYADGTKDTYRSHNQERIGNYVTIDQMNSILTTLQSNTRKEVDTVLVTKQDSVYVYKEKQPSKINQFVNGVGWIALIVILLLIILKIALQFLKF